mmetsp:Transcript_35883/g.55086  ORF Transcript_35883/g.55086 Transcript_35883/m.55086 type:complete len:141 (-) Transcript_35883:1021-1443(-)
MENKHATAVASSSEVVSSILSNLDELMDLRTVSKQFDSSILKLRDERKALASGKPLKNETDANSDSEGTSSSPDEDVGLAKQMATIAQTMYANLTRASLVDSKVGKKALPDFIAAQVHGLGSVPQPNTLMLDEGLLKKQL